MQKALRLGENRHLLENFMRPPLKEESNCYDLCDAIDHSILHT